MQIVEFWNIHTKVKKKIREPLFCPVIQKLKKTSARLIFTQKIKKHCPGLSIQILAWGTPPLFQRGWLHGGGDKAHVICDKFGFHLYVYRETIGNAL